MEQLNFGGTCAGFRDRVLGNPRFLVVLAIELVMGVTGKWSAEVQARGDKFWQARASPFMRELQNVRVDPTRLTRSQNVQLQR